MRYLRVIVYTFLFLVGVVFIIQNYAEFSQTLSIKLNLFIVGFETMPIQAYVLFLISFFVGVVLASLFGLVERVRLKGKIREGKREIDHLKRELDSFRNLPITEEDIPVPAPPLEMEQKEQKEQKEQEEP